jgi:hypothetical protein
MKDCEAVHPDQPSYISLINRRLSSLSAAHSLSDPSQTIQDTEGRPDDRQQPLAGSFHINDLAFSGDLTTERSEKVWSSAATPC